MLRPFYFFPDHESFFSNVPVPHPVPKISFPPEDVTELLRRLVVAFSSSILVAFTSLKWRKPNHGRIRGLFRMNSKVSEHPFFWSWYIDEHFQ